MEGKIDDLGELRIKRAGKLKTQICPNHYDDGGNQITCGDWCPHFSEPFHRKIEGPPPPSGYGLKKEDFQAKDPIKFTELFLCNGKKLQFDNFTDERGSQ